jgi:hypothetical protein
MQGDVAAHSGHDPSAAVGICFEGKNAMLLSLYYPPQWQGDGAVLGGNPSEQPLASQHPHPRERQTYHDQHHL